MVRSDTWGRVCGVRSKNRLLMRFGKEGSIGRIGPKVCRDMAMVVST